MSDSVPPAAQPPTSAGILTVVLLYAAFAAVWILFSDKAVEWLFNDPAHMVLASTLKGWAFVGVTSVLLYRLLRRQAGLDAVTPKSRARWRPMIGSLSLFALAVLVLTSMAIVHTFGHQREKEVARLQAIADLKSRQIADWLRERQGNARFVLTSRFFAENYRRWRDAGDPVSRDILQSRLDEFGKNNSFAAVLLLDEHGERLWGSEKASATIASELRAAARQAVIDSKPGQLGPYRGVAGKLRLDFLAPLTAAGANPPVVVLQVEPADWLFPTLQAWPVPSASGETLLFRRDGDQVLFLNELRHRADTAGKLRVPVAAPKLLAAQVVRGAAQLDSVVEGVDYRDVPVVGVVRAVPGTAWFLVAKLDRSELYDEAIRDAAWIGYAGLLSLFMAAGGLYLLRQRQQLALAEAVRDTQAEKLRTLRLLGAIAEASDDAIFAKDLEGRYILFNRAASDFAGKPAEEVLGRDDQFIFPAEQAEMLRAAGRRVIAENLVHTEEEVLDTPGGKRIFLATKGPLGDTDGTIIGIFGISRDITASRIAEDTLRQQTEELRNRNEELEHFNRVMVGRELDMIALKQQVNSLAGQLGREPPFSLGFLDTPAEPPKGGEAQ